jgi:hypothetical protein
MGVEHAEHHATPLWLVTTNAATTSGSTTGTNAATAPGSTTAGELVTDG